MSKRILTTVSLFVLSSATFAGGVEENATNTNGFFVGVGAGISVESVPDKVSIWDSTNTTENANFGEVGLSDAGAQAAVRAGYIRAFNQASNYAWGVDLTYNFVTGHHTNLLNNNSFYQQNNYEVKNLTTLLARLYMPMSSHVQVDAGFGASLLQLGIADVGDGGVSPIVTKTYVAPSFAIGGIYTLPNQWFLGAECIATFTGSKKYTIYNPGPDEYLHSDAKVRVGEFLLTLNKTI